MTNDRVTIHVRVTKRGCAAVDEEAEAEGRSRSQMVRILLGEALKARKR